MSVAMFLKRLFTSGGLMGGSPEEAYFVKCDEENISGGRRGRANGHRGGCGGGKARRIRHLPY